MSEEFNSYTRVKRYNKKRKNTKAISRLLVIGGSLILLLIGIFVFGGNDNSRAVDDQQEGTSNNDSQQTSDETVSDVKGDEKPNKTLEDESENKAETEKEVESSEPVVAQPNVDIEKVRSEDDNVIEAYIGNWEPIGTEVKEPFQIPWSNWEEESPQSWQELLLALQVATGLEENDLITWWVTSNGSQKVVATVTNKAETENYRVYASWITGEGWAPTRIETLRENDEKYRFEEGERSPEDGQLSREATE